jgi:signal transduction histidine kinase
MVKPFIFAELLARVHALVRRSAKPVEANRVTCGDLVVDLRERKVRRGGQTIELQPKEYTLLEYLLRHRGRTVSKTMIMEHVWDLHFDPQTNVVDVLVCRLRNKIDKTFPQKLIQTIRGIGYIIDAMDISEAQAGTMRLSIQPMDFVPLAESLAEMYRYVGEERGIQIETDFPSQARLEADADRISQVLANLLDNAMKLSAPGAVVRVTILNQPGHVQIQVADTGIGISADEIPRIWDRLYRGTQATHQGLGLGLSLVKAVVQAHRGDVQVTSAPGAGTTFIVQLPVQHQP